MHCSLPHGIPGERPAPDTLSQQDAGRQMGFAERTLKGPGSQVDVTTEEHPPAGQDDHEGVHVDIPGVSTPPENLRHGKSLPARDAHSAVAAVDNKLQGKFSHCIP